ncbi:putative T7SS-secreted protein [Catenulispora pinisilvae]|uniref:putative T7SS-secreted protein n=1 Tax=Catenulispora pinisilvae TaxID=2705253 RepID=UPI001891E2E6|nr:hypothetical protein [Catenulispora pinisilvae]
MAARNGNDWSVFCRTSDPVPGDVGQIGTIAQKLTDRETAAHMVAVGVNGLCTDPALGNWLGASGDAFRNTLEPLPGMLRSMVDAFNQASGAMSRYAAALTSSQSAADGDYRRRDAALKAAAATNGGVRPHLRVGSFGFVDAPPGVPDTGDWYTQQDNLDNDAVPQHDQARAALVRDLNDANDTLRRVLSSLGNPAFTDFNAQYAKNGGDPSALNPSSFQGLGIGLEDADASDLSDILNGGQTDLDPDAVREELSQVAFDYQNDPEFWKKFGPSLANVVDWLHAHQGPGDSDATDQSLIQDLGHRVSGAASSGALTESMLAGLGTAGLIGLGKLIGTTPGADFGDGQGAQFLSDLSRLYINKESGLSDQDPSQQDLGGALNTVLNTTSQNKYAAIDLFSGADGQDLATKLLHGCTVVSAEFPDDHGYDNSANPEIPGLDPKTVAALFTAACPRSPADVGARGSSPLAQQTLQAGFNIIEAAAAYNGWQPPNPTYGKATGSQLPSPVSQSLEGYAKAYSFDLGSSAQLSNVDGVSHLGVIQPDGQPLQFLISHQQLHNFLSVALQDPHSAADFAGFTQGNYQNALKLSFMGGPDYTKIAAGLVGMSQDTLNDMHLSGAAAQDAANAQHAALVNAILGGLGNAPSGTPVGVGQAVDGFLTPYIDQLPMFSTDNQAKEQIIVGQSNAQLSGSAMSIVVQAAVESGKLPIGGLDGPPANAFDHGRLIHPEDLNTWWASVGWKLKIQPDSGQIQAPTLGTYADQVKNAIGDNQPY